LGLQQTQVLLKLLKRKQVTDVNQVFVRVGVDWNDTSYMKPVKAKNWTRKLMELRQPS